MRSRWLACLLCLGLGSLAAGAEPADDGLLTALRQELARSKSELRQPGQAPPYFLQYDARDIRRYEFQAQDGALVHSLARHSRPFRVEARVGNYEQDSAGSGGGGNERDGLVLDDDIQALRHDLWLSSDEAYRQSLQGLAMRKSRPKPKTPAPADFSAAPALTLIEPINRLNLDQRAWEEVLRRLSKLGQQYPAILRMRASADFSLNTHYLLNSEGTELRQSFPLAMIVVNAEIQMPDGALSSHLLTFTAPTPAQLPSEAAMAAEVGRWCQLQAAWTQAPTLTEDYLGPVLFIGPAACDLFGEVLFPLISPGSDRLNKPVLPVSVNVVDDPGVLKIGDRFLMGARQIDEEGVRTQVVPLIEQGKLTHILTSRKPGKNHQISNGHGHASGLGAEGGIVPSSMIVSSTEGKSPAELKELLLRRCREEGLDFGLLVRSAGPADSGEGGRTATTSIYYKVAVATGEEQMIQGVRRERLNLRGFRRMLGLGNEPAVANYVSELGGFSIVSPSLLLSELEVTAAPERPVEPMILPAPPRSKP